MGNISSQGTKVEIWNGVAPVQHVTTAVTKAKPAVVSVAVATGLAVGDVVVPVGTGFKSIDDMPFRVSAVSTLDITLEDSDTTAEAGTAVAGHLDEYTLVELCMANFQVNQPAGATLDVTTMCDVARKSLTGLAGQGTWTANGFWDVSDANQLIARDAYRSQNLQVFRAKFRDNSGILFRGTLGQNDIGTAVDAPVTVAIGGNIYGYVNRAIW
jgi:hypothetical protein